MNKKSNRILLLIGIVLSILLLLGGIFTQTLENNKLFQKEIKIAVQNDISLTNEDANNIIEFVGIAGLVISIVALLSLIIGVASYYNLKNNKKIRVTKIILIVGSILIGLFTVGIGFLQSLLYLIVGLRLKVQEKI